MTPDDITALFTHADGFRCARWGRPIVPVVFGVEDATLALVKGGIEAVVTAADHRMADHDPELGANLMVFFFAEWEELKSVPDLGRMIDLDALPKGETARLFRFDAQGAIRMAMLFVRMGGPLADLPPEALVLEQAARMMLTFAGDPPMLDGGDLRPDVAALLRAAYDPVLPARSEDPAHALRLAART